MTPKIRDMTTRVLLLIGFVLLSAFPAAAANFSSCQARAGIWRDVSGRWIAAVGPIDLQANGNRVTGVYNEGKWALTLRYSVDRKRLYGNWDHLNGLAGPVVFFLDERGCVRHAKWGGTGKPPCTPFDSSACVNDWAIHGRAGFVTLVQAETTGERRFFRLTLRPLHDSIPRKRRHGICEACSVRSGGVGH